MKNDELYPLYLSYLDWQLNEYKINRGKWSLLKISNSKFEEFKTRFENDELFSDRILELYKSEIRDKKIDDIFDDID
jgi:hypothetical protein